MKEILHSQKATFEPHFVFYFCDEDCKKSPEYLLYCVSDGKYCHPENDEGGPLRGKDSVL